MDAPNVVGDCTRTDRDSPICDVSGRSHGRAEKLLRGLRNRAADDSGQSLILVVLFMFVIVAVAAFAIDAGQMSVAHHKAQIAADASALSAAQDMESATTPAATVTTDATTIAGSNYPGSTDTIGQPNGASGNTATSKVTSPVNLTFGNFFGLGHSQVQATATAQVTSAAAQIGNSNISQAACGNSTTTNCSYTGGNTVIPGSTSGTGNWAVTAYPENDAGSNGTTKSCGFAASTPAAQVGTAGNGVFVCGTPYDWTGNASPPDSSTRNNSSAASQVNLQDCGGGTSGAGACYPPCPTGMTCNGSNQTANPYIEVVDLNGQGEGGMWQSVPTIPNAKYTLSFQVTGNPALGNYTTFYMDVQIVDGINNQYTPFVASPNTESFPTCSSTVVSGCIISSNYYTILDPTYNGSVAAQFYQETISFTAKSTNTTLTFNSEQSDNDAYDSSYGGGYFNCGPEITNISMNYPQIILTQ